jgi:uncharacterized protein YcnI
VIVLQKIRIATALFGALALATVAQAHITLQGKTAPVGSFHKVVLQVPHGCDGSDTTEIKVQIPEGVVDVKPQPKADWTLQLKDGAYSQPVKLHGATLDHGVREVSWSGDLPDAYYDEFAFMAYLAPSLKVGQTLYFPVVQTCKKGVARWIDTTGNHQAANPAPSLKLTPATHAGH